MIMVSRTLTQSLQQAQYNAFEASLQSSVVTASEPCSNALELRETSCLNTSTPCKEALLKSELKWFPPTPCRALVLSRLGVLCVTFLLIIFLCHKASTTRNQTFLIYSSCFGNASAILRRSLYLTCHHDQLRTSQAVMATIMASRPTATGPQPTSVSNAAQSHPYTCNTCQVAFRNSDLQRSHMRTDWQ